MAFPVLRPDDYRYCREPRLRLSSLSDSDCKIKHKKNVPDHLERFGKDLGRIWETHSCGRDEIPSSSANFSAISRHWENMHHSNGVMYIGRYVTPSSVFKSDVCRIIALLSIPAYFLRSFSSDESV